jgi:hypothetical protein
MKPMLIAAAAALFMFGTAFAREAAVSPIVPSHGQGSPSNIALRNSTARARAAYHARRRPFPRAMTGVGTFAKR